MGRGAAITAISIAAIVAFSDWEEWLNLLLEVWLVISPWVIGFVHTRAMHVSILIGAMIAFFAALELWLTHYEPNYGSEHETQAAKLGAAGPATIALAADPAASEIACAWSMRSSQSEPTGLSHGPASR